MKRRERWFWQNTQRSNSPSQTSSETYKAMLNAQRPLTTGFIYKCKQFPFDSTDETLVYQDDLQLGNNFVSDGQFFNGFCPATPKRVNICHNKMQTSFDLDLDKG